MGYIWLLVDFLASTESLGRDFQELRRPTFWRSLTAVSTIPPCIIYSPLSTSELSLTSPGPSRRVAFDCWLIFLLRQNRWAVIFRNSVDRPYHPSSSTALYRRQNFLLYHLGLAVEWDLTAGWFSCFDRVLISRITVGRLTGALGQRFRVLTASIAGRLWESIRCRYVCSMVSGGDAVARPAYALAGSFKEPPKQLDAGNIRPCELSGQQRSLDKSGEEWRVPGLINEVNNNGWAKI